jgi:hypothetical protein
MILFDALLDPLFYFPTHDWFINHLNRQGSLQAPAIIDLAMLHLALNGVRTLDLPIASYSTTRPKFSLFKNSYSHINLKRFTRVPYGLECRLRQGYARFSNACLIQISFQTDSNTVLNYTHTFQFVLCDNIKFLNGQSNLGG